MDTNSISADGADANAVSTVATTDAAPTPAAETVPAPHIEPRAQSAAASAPPAAEPTPAEVAPAAGAVISHVAAAAEPVIAKIAPTAEPAASRVAPIVEPAIAVAGLEPTPPVIGNAGLWRKMRPEAFSAARAAPAAPKRPVPVIKPPVHERSAAARPAPSRSGRFALLAASIALVAGLGAAAGAAGFAGVTKLMAPAAKSPHAAIPAPLQRSELAEETRGLKDALAQMRGNIRLLADSIAGVRTNIDNSGKTSGAQVAKLGEHVAKLHETVERLERSQSEPAARLAKVTETLERLERRAAAMANAPEPAERRAAPASSAPATHAAPVTPAAPPAPETTATIAPPATTAAVRGSEPGFLRPPAVEGWTVRRVFGGVAYIEGPDRIVEVEPGDNIRGVGRVEEIRRQGGRWVVVTNRGLIFSR